MSVRNFIKSKLDECSESRYAEIWNNYCEQNNYPDQMLYPMEQFNTMFGGKTPLEIVDIGKNVNTNDDWFVYNEIYSSVAKSDCDPRYLTEEEELIDWLDLNAISIGLFTEADFREAMKEEMGEETWNEFLAWYESEYDGDMFDLDFATLVSDWEESKEQDRSEKPWDYGRHFD